MQRFLYLTLLCLFISCYSTAQYVDSGQDPASVKWSQINTDNFQVIFPDFFYKEANKLANALELVYIQASKTLDHKPHKISVIVRSYNCNGNANVLWAPKRSNFHSVPPQDVNTQDWLDQLAIHEFRHVVQIDKMHQGFTKILYFLLGEQATAGTFLLYVPFWLTEGDAVVTETALSNSGRGRQPSFEMELRAQVLEKGIYPYEKAYLGSYKDFVSDYYTLGYHLTALGRNKYGAEMWAGILERVAKKPFFPFVFSNSLKKSTGLNKRQFYKENLIYLDSLWSVQDKQNPVTPFKRINNNKRRFYTSYRLPQFLTRDKWVVLKTGYGQIAELVAIDETGDEEHIMYPGAIQDEKLSLEKNLIAWCEYDPDIRWSNRIYSNVITYDLKTGKRKELTSKTYYFAPDISPDGTKIAAVEATPDYKFSIVILNAKTGELIQKISSPGNEFLITPEWSDAGDKVAVILLEKSGKSLQLIDLSTKSFKEVLKPVYKDITYPVFYKNYIFFHGTWSGLDNIYAVDTTSRNIYQVTSSRFGAFFPATDSKNNKIAYSDFSSNGYNLAVANLNTNSWTPIDSVKDNSLKLYEELKEQEELVHFDTSAYIKYQAEPYKKWKHLINLHSWALASAQYQNLTLRPSVSFLSQNKLSTAFTDLSYIYNLNEGTGTYSGSFTYKGFYPEITLGGSVGNRYRPLNQGKYMEWRESVAFAGLALPLNLMSGKYFQGIEPGIQFRYVNIDRMAGSEPVIEGNLRVFQYSLYAYRYLRTSGLDIAPRWGQTLFTGLNHTPWGAKSAVPQFFAQASFYLPGLHRHHSLEISGGYEENYFPGKYSFVNSIIYPRGYTGIFNEKTAVARVNYRMPLLYPDLNIPSVFYWKRLYGNMFFDYGVGYNKGLDPTDYQSIGGELIVDFHLFGHILPLSAGGRYSYLPQKGNGNFQLILNIVL